ncbi:hypothetical protein DMUE_2041, partial [Dictyocoela muelleri]
GIDKRTVSKIKAILFQKINTYWLNNPIRLGGYRRNVRVDETKLNFNVRSHRGRSPTSAIWAITIVDTPTIPALGYAEIVESHSADILIPIIDRVVRPGSYISTDEWAAYGKIESLNGYIHSTVCHKYHFVDPNTHTHTQHVESLNNKIKYEIKKRRGFINSQKGDFLTYFLFIDHHKDDALTKILDIIKFYLLLFSAYLNLKHLTIIIWVL